MRKRSSAFCFPTQDVHPAPMKILVIEDDPTVGQFVKRGFEEQRWGVDLVANGDDGEARAISEEYDVVILDMRLPGKSGAQVLHDLRARGFERPVLILTAQDAIDSKVETLRAGADDYVTKPFAFEELLARVEALSRRPRARMTPVLKVADLSINLDTREVTRGGHAIELTPKEYTVIEYLMRHAGRVMSRTLITEYAWGYHFDPGTNIVDVVINHLRKKIDANSAKKLIHTIRGVGYAIREEISAGRGG
jgi:DNA-binding response OmpR family regulator